MGSAVYISVSCWEEGSTGVVPCGISSVSMGSDEPEGTGDQSSLINPLFTSGGRGDGHTCRGIFDFG
jgi:hypothetical protein